MTFLLRWEDEKGPAGLEKGEAWNRQPGEQVQHPEERQQQKKDGIRVRGTAAGPGQQGPVHTGSVAQVRRVGFCFCFISEMNGAWGGWFYMEKVFTLTPREMEGAGGFCRLPDRV